MKKLLIAIVALVTITVSGKAQNVSIPFELYGDHIIIKLQVNNSRELDFVFDTGDGLTVLDIETAKELGISSTKTVSKTSAEGHITGYLVKHQKIEMKDFELKNVTLYETSLTHLEMAIGRGIDGIIGYDILNHHVVHIDYDNMLFELHDQDDFTYRGDGKKVDFKLVNYIPTVEGHVEFDNGEVIDGSFYVNTGAKATLDFNTPVVESKQLTSKIGESYVYMAAGIGEVESEHHRGRVKSFTFDNFTFDNLPVGLSHAKDGIQNSKKVTGIVGNRILERFNAVFDYLNKTLYLEKNGKYNDDFMVSASGLELQLNRAETEVLIHRIYENSPVSNLGLTINDRIVEIEGKKASEYTLPALRKMLSSKSVAKTVKMKVETNQGTKDLEITLKPLI